MQKKSSSSFKYKPRTAEDIRSRAVGGGKEGFVAEGIRSWTPKAGAHDIRILPPTWDNARHYGYDVFAHYNVGPDGTPFLCLKKMKNESCPICDERSRAAREGDDELSDELKWRQRVACYVIVRGQEREGPMLWFMPKSFDTDLAKISTDKKDGSVYDVADPDEGYDVSFEREGQGLNTKYQGLVIDRRKSPLSDDDREYDDWIKFISDHPIPDVLIFRTQEELEDVVGDGLVVSKRDRGAKKGNGKDEAEEKAPSGRPRLKDTRRDEEEEEERPRRRAPARDEEEEEEEKPAKRRSARDEGEEEEEKPRRRSSSRDEEEEEDEEKPRRRSSSRDEEDEEEEDKPRSKRSSKDDDDEDEKPLRKRMNEMRKRTERDDA